MTSKIDVRPEHRRIVQSILHKHVPMHPVWIFGSRALGTAKKASDLDLAIVGENPLDPLTLANLNNAFSESDLPYKVDVIDFSTVSDGFRTIIQNQHIVLKDPE